MGSHEATTRGLRTSAHSVVLPVGEDTFAAWNRYFPNVLMMNRQGAALLMALRNEGSAEGVLDPATAGMLLSHRLVFQGEEDPYAQQFAGHIDDAVSSAHDAMTSFYRERKDYAVLYLSNDPCNLSCRYCIHRAVQSEAEPRGVDGMSSLEERLGTTLNVVDQYVSRKRSATSQPATLAFNGGEILVDWPLVRRTVEHLERRHADVPVTYTLNTNMTLMTAEIAEFLAARSFNVYVSIDGYGAAHDRTRVYRNGRGSYQDVLRNIALFNAKSPTKPIQSFQGTIEEARTFRPTNVFRMARFGFRSARLAPNLLGSTREDGTRKARLVSRLFAASESKGLRVYDEYFKNVEALHSRMEDAFLPNCNGLSGDPANGLQFNVSKLQLSQGCQFLPEAFLSWAEVKGDIYSERLGAAAHAALKRRLAVLRDSCRDCDVAGICRGGCVLNGLDSWARLSPGACAYQRELWLEVVRRGARRQARAEALEQRTSETESDDRVSAVDRMRGKPRSGDGGTRR